MEETSPGARSFLVNGRAGASIPQTKKYFQVHGLPPLHRPRLLAFGSANLVW